MLNRISRSISNYASMGANSQSVEASNKLSQRVQDLDAEYKDPQVLNRFLLANEMDVFEAEKKLRALVKWKAEFRPQAIRKSDIQSEYHSGKMILLGEDKLGRPCICIFPFQHSPETRNKQICVKMIVYFIERAISQMKPNVSQFVIIVDLKQFSRKNLDFYLVKDLIKLQKLYPERLGAMYIIRKNWLFQQLTYPMLKTLLDPNTFTKIEVLGSDYKDTLLRLFDANQLLVEHGGSLTHRLVSFQMENSEAASKILLEMRTETAAETDEKIQSRIYEEITQEIDSCSSLSEKQKDELKSVIPKIKTSVIAKGGKRFARALDKDLSRTTSSLRTRAEALQLDIALLAIRKNDKETIIKEAEKAVKELPLLEKKLKEKHAELARTIKQLTSQEEIENKLSILKDSAKRRAMLDSIPKHYVAKLSNSVVRSMSGPDEHEQLQKYHHWLAARSVSLYPVDKEKGGREGDPIADRFSLCCFTNCAILTVADGCGWGSINKDAAATSTDIFVEFMKSFKNEIVTTTLAARYALRAMSAAHDAIMQTPHDAFWNVGTTTLLGGMVLELMQDNSEYQWLYVFASVGDQKAFVYSPKRKKVYDVTAGNRIDATDCKDPGGRLGPTSKEGGPDLRNLELYAVGVESGEYIILTSDGVHDNFDPQYCGLIPGDFDLKVAKDTNPHSWDNVLDKKLASEVKVVYMTSKMCETLNNVEPRADKICSALIDAAIQNTKAHREFYENDIHPKMPVHQMPGKLDHATVVVYQVGRREKKSKKDKKVNHSNASTPSRSNANDTPDDDPKRIRSRSATDSQSYSNFAKNLFAFKQKKQEATSSEEEKEQKHKEKDSKEKESKSSESKKKKKELGEKSKSARNI